MIESNLLNISRNASFTALLALGSMVVIMGKGIDVSIGSILGLAGIVCAHLLSQGNSLLVGLIGGLGIATAAGIVNGILIAYLKLSPLVVTIATLALYRSLALIVSRGNLYADFGYESQTFLLIGGGSISGLPGVVLVLIIVASTLALALKFSTWGVHLRAVGSSESAALANGVNVKKVKLSSYLVSSLFAGLSGIILVSWLGGVTSDLGTGYELNAIAAAVIGGTSLAGAKGSVPGTIFGALLFEVIRNSLVLLGVDALWHGFFVGSFIIAALVIDRSRRT